MPWWFKTPHVRVYGFKFQLWAVFWLSANEHLRREQVMAPVAEFL